MITKNTVFILGAGASSSFGLPLGNELLEIIVNSLKYKPATEFVTSEIIDHPDFIFFNTGHDREIDDDSRSDNRLFQMLLNNNFTKVEIEKFANNLIRSQINSVDAFLEFRTEFIEIGKQAIAYNLLKFESEEQLNRNPNWYKEIWVKMSSSYEDFDKNKVSFITFNYDRSLEFYLVNAMNALFDRDGYNCFKKLSNIPIIHLHGKLGNLPWENTNNSIEYGKEIADQDALLKVAKEIKIIHENVENNEAFSKAVDILKAADWIYILGLGYNQKNLDRLQLNKLSKKIIGSSYGLSDIQKKEIQAKNKNIILEGHSTQDCLNFFKEQIFIE